MDRRTFLGTLPILPALAHAGADRPATLAMQPTPKTVFVAHVPTSDGWVTSIARTWASGDAERCRLCPRSECRVRDGVCLAVTNRFVAHEDAAMFRIG